VSIWASSSGGSTAIREYFILEKDGIAVAGIMGASELEDYLELQDPTVREHIRKSNADYLAGRVAQRRILSPSFVRRQPTASPSKKRSRKA